MGKASSFLAFFVIAGIAAFIGNSLLPGEIAPPPLKDAGWWGRGPPEEDTNTNVTKVIVSISDAVLQDLKFRLDNARLGEDLQDTQFQYGFQVGAMKQVLEHWRTKYDWRVQEAKLNQFSHYQTQIEGIRVHFLRVTPPNAKGKPLMLVHGWPGSIWEFYQMIPMLTDPTQYGGSADDTFEVIVPCIPGFGFSEAPHQKGFAAVDAARIFVKLMKRLGFDKYYYQGGDWGGLIGTVMAQAYPQSLLGVHLNMYGPDSKSLSYNFKLLVGSVFPSLVGLSEVDVQRVYPLFTMFTDLLRETGYAHIQATKPDTVAFSLNDSPVGLAAYILEKFCQHTNPTYIDLPDGGLTRKYSMDDLLTNVMIYWVTGTIGPSMRFYKENIPASMVWDSVPVTVPAGLAYYEYELVPIPRAFVTDKFQNIVQFTDMPDGGHFAALEGPERLTQDIRSFVRKVEQSESEDDH